MNTGTKPAHVRLWWLTLPVSLALGSLAWAFIRPTVECFQAGDVGGCTDSGLVNVLVGVGGVFVAAVLTLIILIHYRGSPRSN